MTKKSSKSKVASRGDNRGVSGPKRNGEVPTATGAKNRGFLHTLQETLELDDLRNRIEEWFGNPEGATFPQRIGFGVSVLSIALVTSFLGLFTALIPLTYGACGWLLYRNQGWRFFQPGIGGPRFVALNAVVWSMYSIGIVLQIMFTIYRDPLLSFNVYLIGSLSYVVLFGALFSYHPPEKKSDSSIEEMDYDMGVNLPSEAQLNNPAYYKSPTFNRQLQNSVLMRADDTNPSSFWWVFIGLHLTLGFTAFLACMIGTFTDGPIGVRIFTTTIALWTFSISTSMTHAIGGKWRHISANYAAFQPGKGGAHFVLLQAIAWFSFASCLACGLAAIALQIRQLLGGKPSMPLLMATSGTLGLIAQLVVFCSLFVYRDHGRTATEDVNKEAFERMIAEEETSVFNQLTKTLVKFQFSCMNQLFGPRDMDAVTTKAVLSDPDAHLQCDKRWDRITAGVKVTRDCYLVVGNGFVGARIVNRLLERGETNIRVFDIVENNHWAGDKRVKFIKGDVTKAEDIGKACEGVNTVYSTFAIIQFFARLKHQAFISYHVNVTGTEVLIDAMKKNNVRRCIVTSSSHATTDEHSLPRWKRDETAELVTRDSAHNHYGWTKALADKKSLEANGSLCADGQPLKVCVVRPCSGVFGADDRLTFEKLMDMRCALGVGAESVMDWVYVENVVLGHLLAEHGLQEGKSGVDGEAFCISNDEPISIAQFWFLVTQHVKMLPEKLMRDRLDVTFVWVPMFPLWIIAYVSEFFQWAFKGKLSLGRDLDILTPSTLVTACMSYSYKSDKARKILGYEPVFSVEEAIQRSLSEYYSNRYDKPKSQ